VSIWRTTARTLPATASAHSGTEVERITDEVDAGGGRALAALNRLADGKADPGEVAALLDRLAGRAEAATAELEGLTPPEAAELSAADLAFAAGDVALHRRTAATDVRAIERGISTAASVGRTQARILLAYQSGFSALSRAVRALAVEAG